jgi:hypothetical protein
MKHFGGKQWLGLYGFFANWAAINRLLVGLQHRERLTRLVFILFYTETAI